MKKFFIASAVCIATLAIPAMASAHSGHVTCDPTGVVFSYDANFPANTAVTEHVNGINYSYVPAAFITSTHTDPLPGIASVTVSATWTGGGTIPPIVLTCPVFDVVIIPPVVVPPVTPPVVPPPVVPPVVPPIVPPKPVCGTGYRLHQSNHVNYCLKTVTKIKRVVKIKYVWWCPLPPHKKSGVTG